MAYRGASYSGEFTNPVGTWRVAAVPHPEHPHEEQYVIQVFREEDREIDGVSGRFSYWEKHTSAPTFDDEDEAHDWMDAVEEKYEEDYDRYLEENRYEIAQMERYEQWRNEY